MSSGFGNNLSQRVMRLKLLFFEPCYVATIWVVIGKVKKGSGGEESQGIIIRSSNNRFGHSQANTCKHKNRNGPVQIATSDVVCCC
jgi:hypothetical protein